MAAPTDLSGKEKQILPAVNIQNLWVGQLAVAGIMSWMTKPILYSFRRCPYAMRARMALLQAEQTVELREIVLRDKPAAFFEASPSASVPCLLNDSEVLDESLDVMKWALERNDPDGWLDMSEEGWDWITLAHPPL